MDKSKTKAKSAADRCPVKARRTGEAFANTRYLKPEETPHINSVPKTGRHWAAYN